MSLNYTWEKLFVVVLGMAKSPTSFSLIIANAIFAW